MSAMLLKLSVLALTALVLNKVKADENSGEINFNNDFDGELNFECPANEVFYSIYSVHDNNYEDRRWRFTCRQAPAGATPGRCSWTGDYVNTWDEPVSYVCPRNWVLAGVHSYHSNDAEDRRWKFKCCKDSNYLTYSCDLTSYRNNWDEELRYIVPNGKVIAGWFSVHDNDKEDRRLKLLECSYRE
ncbi:hemagglutinin/amebocyte aggregation factor [Elysia marginata]|uniref:Hemagglutinin/amebocyte aggregation factor n=1 Tax=Elysia marginata TaxID=1093978 RepID=A0AAV4ELJ9_9GAST|nr:hemagglutinin/amebocyte aggregation factor [Elysia marginata]